MKNLLALLLAITFFACSSGEKKTEEKTAAPAEIVEASLSIGGMTCEHCVMSVTKGIEGVEGVESVVVTLEDSTAVVKYDASLVASEDLEKAVEKRGYRVKTSE
ncbi:heavy-metal-associated domain-containing protein [Maribellus sediminis]|uniref:heavy-metal-associated domain-containing protein n=1 Tax=Maribellus sediminis TaxID=2696285 RepID=UPI0014311533|nr:heavy-metal-associated domain-containing protein [Maribellus sediminis]